MSIPYEYKAPSIAMIYTHVNNLSLIKKTTTTKQYETWARSLKGRYL
jgi:hypothetical protein